MKEKLEKLLENSKSKYFNYPVAAILECADGSLYKVGYGKFMFWRLVIEGAVTLLVSGILAVLYYLIWQDEEVEKTTKAPKKLKAKRK